MKFSFLLLFALSLWSIAANQAPLDIKENLKYIEQILISRDHYRQGRCGNWKDSYLKRYQELLAKPDSEKQYLVFVPHLSGKWFLGESRLRVLLQV